MVEKRFEFKRSENGECLGIHVYDKEKDENIISDVLTNKGWEKTFNDKQIVFFNELVELLNEIYEDGYNEGAISVLSVGGK